MLGSKPSSANVNILDFILLVVLLMSWFLVAQVWDNPLPNTMFSVTILYLVISIISKFTGFLKFTKISLPTWTLSAFISIPVWAFLLVIIPTTDSTNVASTLSTSITEGVLSSFFSHNDIVRLMQVILFPITESLLIIFLFAMFGGLSSNSNNTVGKSTTPKLIIPLFIVAAFGAIIHIVVATNLNLTGDISFDISILQQFLSFFIFIATGIIFRAPGIITSHVVKALLIFGTTGWWLAIFGIFILIDIISLLLNKSSTKDIINPKSIFT